MIYLDNAATSYRKPQSVTDAICRALSGMGNAGRGVNAASLEASRLLFETRSALSDLFGGFGPAQTVFTANSTEALNTAIHGLFGPGDHVITTMLEHNSVLRPLYALEAQDGPTDEVSLSRPLSDYRHDRVEGSAHGLQVTILPADTSGNISYDDLEKAIRPNTKAIVTTHASNLTGNLIDIRRIGELCRRHQLVYIVDASQTAGTFPIHMQEMGIDILCVTGHKGLMGPQGTGALLVRKGITLSPLKVGGSGIHTYDRRHPAEMPTALEAGTLNAHGIAGLKGALDHLAETGMEKIRDRELSLAFLFYRGVRDLPGLRLYGDFSMWDDLSFDSKSTYGHRFPLHFSENTFRAPVISLNIRDYDSGEVSDVLLTDYDIQTRSGGHCAPLMHRALGTEDRGAVRFSFGYFNTPEEVDAAIKAVTDLAGE